MPLLPATSTMLNPRSYMLPPLLFLEGSWGTPCCRGQKIVGITLTATFIELNHVPEAEGIPFIIAESIVSCYASLNWSNISILTRVQRLQLGDICRIWTYDGTAVSRSECCHCKEPMDILLRIPIATDDDGNCMMTWISKFLPCATATSPLFEVDDILSVGAC